MGDKRPPVKRNREETIEKLLAAVGELLQEKGYTSLGVNRIAARAGVNKKLIYYYFGGLNPMIKEYIRRKDYWLPLFDSFEWKDEPDRAKVEGLFESFLEEQFCFFFVEPEMQKLILWQISEFNPLMRGISEARETEGAKFLGLTDRYFKDSEVDFRSVVALLVGGIYYIVLHAKHNKSSVCGIDVNREKDYKVLLKTIRQVLQWVWSTAKGAGPAGSGIKGDTGMKYELGDLEKLVSAYKDGEKNEDIQKGWDPALERFKRALMEGALQLEGSKLPLYIRWHQEGLVELLNGLDEFLETSNRDEAVAKMRLSLGKLLDFLERSFPVETNNDVEIPVNVWREFKQALSASLDKIGEGLKVLGINDGLAGIVLIPLRNRLDERVISLPGYREYRYLTAYCRELEHFLLGKHENMEEALLNKLLQLNLNHQLLLEYWVTQMEGKLEGSKDRLALLTRLKRAIRQVAIEPGLSYNPLAPSLQSRLDNWLEEELVLTGVPEDTKERLKINLPVQGIAYFNKLLYRHQFFAEENQSLIIRHMVDTFSSIDTDQMSLNSYASKYRAKEPTDAVAIMIRKLLKPMLEEVDRFLK